MSSEIDAKLKEDFKAFIARNQSRIGTGEQAIAYAMTIDDHFDLRLFLEDWQTGMVANLDEYSDYRDWLAVNRQA